MTGVGPRFKLPDPSPETRHLGSCFKLQASVTGMVERLKAEHAAHEVITVEEITDAQRMRWQTTV